MVIVLDIYTNIWIVLAIFAFVWIFGWAKNNLGSAKLALVLAVLIAYLTFYSHPDLVWIGVGLFVLATFGKDLFDKVNVLKK